MLPKFCNEIYFLFSQQPCEFLKKSLATTSNQICFLKWTHIFQTSFSFYIQEWKPLDWIFWDKNNRGWIVYFRFRNMPLHLAIVNVFWEPALCICNVIENYTSMHPKFSSLFPVVSPKITIWLPPLCLIYKVSKIPLTFLQYKRNILRHMSFDFINKRQGHI